LNSCSGYCTSSRIIQDSRSEIPHDLDSISESQTEILISWLEIANIVDCATLSRLLMVKNELKLGFGYLHWLKNQIRLTRSEHKFREIEMFLGPLIAQLQRSRAILYIRQTTTLKKLFDSIRLSPDRMNRRQCLLTPCLAKGQNLVKTRSFKSHGWWHRNEPVLVHHGDNFEESSNIRTISSSTSMHLWCLMPHFLPLAAMLHLSHERPPIATRQQTDFKPA
jgi:hypothetical protein